MKHLEREALIPVPQVVKSHCVAVNAELPNPCFIGSCCVLFCFGFFQFVWLGSFPVVGSDALVEGWYSAGHCFGRSMV